MICCRMYVLLLAWVVASGCTTYVNIPGQLGDFARHNPNDLAVRAVLAESLTAIAEAYPVEDQFAILLPDTTTAETYHAVTKKTNKQAVWPGNKDRADLPILEVKQVRIRRQDAWVDIVRTLHSNSEQMEEMIVTVELKWHPLQGWLTQRVRPWNLTMENAFWVSADETD